MHRTKYEDVSKKEEWRSHQPKCTTNKNAGRINKNQNEDTREMGSANPLYTSCHTIFWGTHLFAAAILVFKTWHANMTHIRSLPRLRRYKTFHPRTISRSVAIVHLGAARRSHRRPPPKSKINQAQHSKNVPAFGKTHIEMEILVHFDDLPIKHMYM